MVTYYHVLGLAPTASQQQILEAFRHISSNNDNTQIDRLLVNEAFGTLSTPENRDVYDEWLRDRRPLGNRSLAFLNTEVKPAEAASRTRVNPTTPSPPRRLAAASSPQQSHPAQEDRKATSAGQETLGQADDER
ncbi:MAG: hypothetical protein Q9196_005211, partial [Gyalolechia fulgens]